MFPILAIAAALFFATALGFVAIEDAVRFRRG